MTDQIKAWPNDHAPVQNVPLTSSDQRMHVMDENCWCEPMILASGQGDEFTIQEIDHQSPKNPRSSH